MKYFALCVMLCALMRTGAALGQDVPPPPPPPDTADTGAPAPAIDASSDLRAEVVALKAQVAALQARLDQMQGAPPAPAGTPVGEPVPPPETAPGGEPAPPPETAGTASPSGGGKSLLLPDISYIGTALAHASSDKRDQDRSRIFLDSGEIGIQSYVYPGVKADAFITGSRPDFNMAVEETYLTVLNITKGLSGQIGKRKVPFGRVNQLHPHSWLYIVQPYALTNLVAEESLTAQGGTLSYLLPTKGGLFAQVDAGLWNSPDPATIQPADTADIHVGSGAAFEDRFQTLRLWTGAKAGQDGEFELGVSGAHGNGQRYALTPETMDHPQTTLAGADLSYRHYGKASSRTLLRGEYIWHQAKSDLHTDTARGYYLFADHRVNPYREYGLRYDWSEFPFAPGLHEAAVSGIFTNQLTEQTYLRLQLIHGDRPGKSNFNEAWFEWVWGLGPHTHNLE